ncbi:MAG: fatty acid--CoA ligase [Bacteroidetes bacterium]|nr:MAG: fatty acid--CoA ligase [Bacteroidota bacterium]
MQKFPDYSFDYQLLIKHLLDKVLDWKPKEEIHYRDKFSYTYAEMYKRVHKLANLLKSLGVEQGDMVAVIDWDSHRYLENYFAVPMMGAVLHTVNIRLSPEQMLYTINHAEDKVLIFHKDFEPIILKIQANFETVKHIIYISDGDLDYTPKYENVGEYEELVEKQDDFYDFPDFDENTIATTFYTTGTTGNPKGVYFSHRQLVLHTITGVAQFGAFPNPAGFNQNDVYMPLTPMFHVHAWGVPYIATVLGVKQIYPGRYDEMIVKLLVQHKVTFSHCVPTILQMVVGNPATESLDFSNWKVVIGGSALSKGLARAAMKRNVQLMTGYGMSETAPILTLAVLKPGNENIDFDEKLDIITRTGFPEPLVQMKVVDENMDELPRGKENVGEIVVRSPWLTKGYFKLEEKSKELWRGGWLHTGDIAYRDEEGYFKITDRLKDVIKTGGEWVSSLEIENMISQCESIAQVAVIGIPDEKWGERPVAFVVHKQADEKDSVFTTCKNTLMTFVNAGKIEKWAIPDRFIVLDDIPKTSVGKIDKKQLRIIYKERYAN